VLLYDVIGSELGFRESELLEELNKASNICPSGQGGIIHYKDGEKGLYPGFSDHS